MLHTYFESINAKIAAAIGMVTGLLKYTFLQVTQTESYFESVGKAALTALICGLAGVAGKEIYALCKRIVVKKMALKSNRKNGNEKIL